MRKIEDIKPPKKKFSSIKQPILKAKIEKEDKQFFEDLFYYPVEIKNKKQKPIRHTKSRKFIFLFAIIIFLVLVGFFVLSSIKIKNSLIIKLRQTENTFAKLSGSVRHKDIFAIIVDLKKINDDMNAAMIDLQSIGQDIYVIDLIYPKNKISKVSKLTNSVRVANALIFSYSNLINLPAIQNNRYAIDWVDQVNSFLNHLQNTIQIFDQRIKYSTFVVDLFTPSINFSCDDLDQEEKKSIEKIHSLSSISSDFLHYFQSIPENISQSLGDNNDKKSYLILFQNNAEIRPSGGFLGSFARLDFENGQLTKIDFEKNIYTLDKTYLASGKAPDPPEEFKNFIDKLTMRDSNIYADFEESAKNVIWFYEQESGNKIDGVFAVDTTLFRKLLDITGPIEMSDYGLLIDSDNFLRDVQYQVEIGYFEDKSNWSENQPKKILSDMLPVFMKKLLSINNKKDEILKTIFQSIEEKHLLVYLANDKLEDLAKGVNMAGKVINTSGDYIYINDSNIGGKKSSLNVIQTLNHQIKILESGSVEEKVSVVKKHQGSYEWPDGTNKNYTNVFLPLSSNVTNIKLISGSNQPNFNGQIEGPAKISTQYGKTKVSFWQITEPGETSQTDIEYSRDKAIKYNEGQFDYQIYIQKQPGIEFFKYNLELIYPEGWEPINVSKYNQNTHTIKLSYSVLKDTSFTIKFIHSDKFDLLE